MKTFVRMSKLSDIVGRSDYISNPDRQEHIVAAENYAHWKDYQAYERKHQRSSEPNNEGRELIIALPNEWYQLPKSELSERMNDIAKRLLPGRDEYQWAVHWNKARTNLHAHLIFSERTRGLSSSEVWDRDIYLTQDGKVARRKADRAVDKNGKVKPPVHRKGEPKSTEFTTKDKIFKSKQWLEDAKQTIAAYFKQQKVTVEDPALLHQYHEGKGSDAPAIREKNKNIRRINANFKRFQNLGYVFPPYSDKRFKEMQKAALQPDYKPSFADMAAFADYVPKLSMIITKNKDTAISLYQQLGSEHIQSIYGYIPEKGNFLCFPEQHKARVNQLKQQLQPPPPPTPEKKAPAAAAPVPAQQSPQKAPEKPKKPLVNIGTLISLKNEYHRICCAYYYLQLTQTSTSAQQQLKDAVQLVRSYSDAADKLFALDDDIRHTINPIKKHKLRQERDAAADKVGSYAAALRESLGITLYYAGTDFNCRTASAEHIRSIAGYTTHPISELRKAAEQEQKNNRMIEELSGENINEQAVSEALRAFRAACNDVPEEQQREAYRRLQDSPVPPIDYGTSTGRHTAHDNISKAMAVLSAPTVQTKSKQQPVPEETEDLTQHFGRSR